jgi:hypothetical protein
MKRKPTQFAGSSTRARHPARATRYIILTPQEPGPAALRPDIAALFGNVGAQDDCIGGLFGSSATLSGNIGALFPNIGTQGGSIGVLIGSIGMLTFNIGTLILNIGMTFSGRKRQKPAKNG